MAEITPQTQHMLMQLQQYQNQQQMIAVQKQQIELQLAEIDAALAALKEVKEEQVYKAVGPIMVKLDRGSVTNDLGKNKELLELRIETLNKQEDKVKNKMKEVNGQVAKNLPKAG